MASVTHQLGSVPYLNAKPLIYGMEAETALAVPSKLANQFRSGAYDAALIPVYEALTLPRARWVDGVAIGCNGAVYSVYLAYRGALSDVHELALDPASRTSVHLLQVMLREFLNLSPTLLPEPRDANTARLMIGDPAIDFRLGDPSGWNYLDLGAEWKLQTGLPFVFACWVLGDASTPSLADKLRSAKVLGVSKIDAIATTAPNPTFAFTYLTQHICYEFGTSEKQGLICFANLLAKHDFLPQGCGEIPEFI